ncbi:hypothetical protein [Salinispira pacifica]|uniref:Uncharacterized protein n=1 Tax=Salinispira pacifica TaxID=1307761 RepID=V5WD95_9SPIO|nr:hypothetical protein [Salinispira pacifica]AHC13514.1 hypothetical protein L21SP2_0068 [Salinispira pacifica]
MKAALVIPLRYILILLLLTGLIIGYSVLLGAAEFQRMDGGDRSTLTLLYLVRGMKSGLYLGGILAVIICIRSVLSLRSARSLALMLLFIVAMPTFFFGYYGVRQLENSALSPDYVHLTGLSPAVIHQFSGGGVYHRETNTNLLLDVVLYHHSTPVYPGPEDLKEGVHLVPVESEIPRLSSLESVVYNSSAEEIIVNQRSNATPDSRALVIPVDEISNSRAALFHRSGIIGDIDTTVGLLFETLDEYADDMSYRYAALIFSLMLFLFSTFVFMRLTRWPLINFILAVIVNIAGLMLTRVHELFFIRDIAGSFLRERAMGYIAPGLLSFIAIIFIIMNVFLPSIKEWSREVGE